MRSKGYCRHVENIFGAFQCLIHDTIEFLATVRLKTLYETLHICRVNEFSLSLYFQHKYSLYGQFRGQKVMISILYLNAKLNPLLIDENYFLN